MKSAMRTICLKEDKNKAYEVFVRHCPLLYAFILTECPYHVAVTTTFEYRHGCSQVSTCFVHRGFYEPPQKTTPRSPLWLFLSFRFKRKCPLLLMLIHMSVRFKSKPVREKDPLYFRAKTRGSKIEERRFHSLFEFSEVIKLNFFIHPRRHVRNPKKKSSIEADKTASPLSSHVPLSSVLTFKDLSLFLNKCLRLETLSTTILDGDKEDAPFPREQGQAFPSSSLKAL